MAMGRAVRRATRENIMVSVDKEILSWRSGERVLCFLLSRFGETEIVRLKREDEMQTKLGPSGVPYQGFVDVKSRINAMQLQSRCICIPFNGCCV